MIWAGALALCGLGKVGLFSLGKNWLKEDLTASQGCKEVV